MSSLTEPQVGQLWVGQSTGFEKEIVGVSPDTIALKVIGSGYESNRVYHIMRSMFLDNNVPKGLSQEEFNALRTLEDKGYTITPPPEKKKGKVWVFKTKKDRVFLVDEEVVADDYLCHDKDYSLLAILDWEEGQGL